MKPGLAFLGGFGFALVIGLVLGADLILKAQMVGGVLEILGVGLVGLGLRGKREAIAPETSVWRRLRKWALSLVLRVRYRFGKKTRVSNAATSHAEVVQRATVSIIHPMDPQAPIEEQVAAISKNVTGAFANLERHQKELEATGRRIAYEENARKAEVAEVQAKISRLAVGDLNVEWVGFWWVLVGLLLVTFPGLFVTVFDTASTLLR
ncbi:MAG: hypothetical protein ABFS34_04125 [Gemmatimonadota bacterium]